MPAQTTKPSDYPQAVIQQIERLAQNIVIARKRRKETQAQWAKRLGVSQPTMARIERGDPAVAMASYVMCMWLINPSAALSDLIAPSQDTMALEQEVTRIKAQRPKRASKPPQVSPVPTTRVDDTPHAGEVAKLMDELKLAEPMTKLREELKQIQDPTAKLVEEMRRAQDPIKRLREEMKLIQDPTAKLVEQMRQAQDPLKKLRDELKLAQTPTALGLAALLSKASGNTP